MIKVCKVCQKEFKIKPSHYNKRFTCSRACKGKVSIKEKNIKICPICNISFYSRKNGHENKIYCSRVCSGKGKSKTTSIIQTCLNCNKEFSLPRNEAKRYHCCSNKCGKEYWFRYHRGDNHPHAKIENLTYSGIHQYINRKYGKAPYCVLNNGTCSKNIEWANIYHKQNNEFFSKEEIYNFIPLCESHHIKFDRYDSI